MKLTIEDLKNVPGIGPKTIEEITNYKIEPYIPETPFPDKKYDIIYADPPWQYNTQEVLAKTSILDGKINTHYPTLTIEQLKGLPIHTIRNDACLLFLWVTSPILDVAIETLKVWGFDYSTVGFVWDKKMTNPGHYTMSQVEMCLIGKYGKIPQPRGARNVKQFLSEKRGRHSEKPDTIRQRIEKMFPKQSKIELFARKRYENWDVWGNEV